MKGSSRILFGLGIAAMILAVAAPAVAQCPGAREIGAQGNGSLTARIIIDTATNNCPNDGNEFGAMWDVATGFNTGGPFFGTPDTCAVNTWWLTGGMFLGTNSGIQGYIASPACTMTNCPAPGASVMTVVEDVSADGTNACVIAYLVDETPPAVRWYDHGRTIGGAPGTSATHVMETFPTVDVTSSAGPPPTTNTTQDYRDIVINFHGMLGAAPLPASAGVLFYNIMWAHTPGPADPGRLRAAYTPLKSIAYADAAIIGDMITPVPCPTTTNDTYLVVGLEYAGGVSSVLVGKSTVVECDPTLADPDETQKRPRLQRRRPMGRGGR